MVEEIIGRLPELTGAQIGRLEDEIRRERLRRASSAAGERVFPKSMKAPRRPSRRSWSTAPTRTAIRSWSYAAPSGATGQLVSADPTGTSSFTRVASVGSSTSARPVTHRAPWPPSKQSPWRSYPSPGLAVHERTRSVSWRRLGPRKDDGRDTGAKSSLTIGSCPDAMSVIFKRDGSMCSFWNALTPRIVDPSSQAFYEVPYVALLRFDVSGIAGIGFHCSDTSATHSDFEPPAFNSWTQDSSVSSGTMNTPYAARSSINAWADSVSGASRSWMPP
jgi:hypothetical protein